MAFFYFYLSNSYASNFYFISFYSGCTTQTSVFNTDKNYCLFIGYNVNAPSVSLINKVLAVVDWRSFFVFCFFNIRELTPPFPSFLSVSLKMVLNPVENVILLGIFILMGQDSGLVAHAHVCVDDGAHTHSLTRML